MTDNKDIMPLVAALAAKMKSGGATPEQIQQAVDNYLSENPVQSGKLKLDGTTIKMTEGEN